MTIKMLKKKIENLPDDMRIYADDGDCSMFSNNSEFVALVSYKNMCIIQTKKDFDVNEEITSWYKENEDNFWNDFYESGYDYDDFKDTNLQEKALKYNRKEVKT